MNMAAAMFPGYSNLIHDLGRLPRGLFTRTPAGHRLGIFQSRKNVRPFGFCCVTILENGKTLFRRLDRPIQLRREIIDPAFVSHFRESAYSLS